MAVRHKVLTIGEPMTAERCTGTRTLSAEAALFVSLSASVTLKYESSKRGLLMLMLTASSQVKSSSAKADR